MFLVFALCLGWGELTVSCVLQGERRAFGDVTRLIVGFLSAYLVALVVQDFRWSRPILLIGGCAGLALWLARFFSDRLSSGKLSLPFRRVDIWATLVIFIFLSALLVSSPQMGWDAKSIWFLQYKQVFFAKSVGLSAGWALPELRFSHSDYPKLHALLGAHWLETTGMGWSDQRAKFSLIMLMGLMWAANLVLARGGNLILFWLVLSGVPGEKLFSGYMDVWCAGFAALGAVGVYLGGCERSQEKVFLGWALLVLAAQIKNEGILSLAACFLVFLISRQSLGLESLRAKGFLIASALAWPVIRFSWGLSNDLSLGSFQYFRMVLVRALDLESWNLILKSALWGPSFTGVLGVVAAVVSWIISKRSGSREFLQLCLAGWVYWVAMILVYLGTPHDLLWHLGTSASRVFLFSGQLWSLVLLAGLASAWKSQAPAPR